MNQRSRRRGKRGAIGAPIGMIFIVILVATIVTAQLTMLIDDLATHQEMESAADFSQQRLAERLEIDNVLIATSGANMSIIFTNVGALPLTIDHIWITSTTDTSLHQVYALSPVLPLQPGSTIVYNFFPPGTTLDPTKTYYVKAITQRGNLSTILYPSAETSSGSTVPYMLAFIPGTLQSSVSPYTVWITDKVSASQAKSAHYRFTVVNTSPTKSITLGYSSAISITSTYSPIIIGCRLARATINGNTYPVDTSHSATILPYQVAVLTFSNPSGQGSIQQYDAGFVNAVLVGPPTSNPMYAQTLGVTDAILFT